MDTKTRIAIVVLCWLWIFALFTGLNACMNFMPPEILLLSLFFFLLVDLVFPRWGTPVKILITLILLHRSYYLGSFFSPRWLGWLAADVIGDLRTLSAGGGMVLPVTAMFFSMLALAGVQKLYFALISRGKAALPLLFVGTTLLVSAYMYTGEDVTHHVIIYIIVGLLVMGTSRVQLNFSFPMGRWLSYLLICALVLTSVAWALPDGKFELSQWWQDLMTWRVGRASKGVVRYGSYDGALGLPLEKDETPFLRVTSPRSVYLKGDVRYIYTGNSWETNPADLSSSPFRGFTGGPDVDSVEATIAVEFLDQQERELFVPRHTMEIAFTTHSEVYYRILQQPQQTNPLHFQDFLFSSGRRPQVGDRYIVTALLPLDRPDQLRQLSSTGAPDFYLQLPESTTQRTFDLAQTITEAETNSYDKAAAIVQYLRRGKWQYSLDTAFPPSNQEFVDWFLFKADRGYCVHFSTAFVVLARAAGLPARWVTGFSPGIRQGQDTYIVQNQHAHAWAEVWFDGYGWVPFEPTPGAILPTVSAGGTGDPQDPGDPDEPLYPVEPQDPLEPNPGSQEPQDPVPEEPEPSGGMPITTIALLAAVLLAMTLTIILVRGRKIDAVKLYAKLQTRLRFFGWQRHDWETAREHMERVQELPDRAGYENFIRRFEHSLYGGQAEEKKSEGQQLGRNYSLLKLAWHRVSNRRR